jgi:hypothetical protein
MQQLRISTPRIATTHPGQARSSTSTCLGSSFPPKIPYVPFAVSRSSLPERHGNRQRPGDKQPTGGDDLYAYIRGIRPKWVRFRHCHQVSIGSGFQLKKRSRPLCLQRVTQTRCGYRTHSASRSSSEGKLSQIWIPARRAARIDPMQLLPNERNVGRSDIVPPTMN